MIATILVIDGFGIGAMPDAGVLRSQDAQANTAGAIDTVLASRGQQWKIPTLKSLGLPLLVERLIPGSMSPPVTCVAHRVALGYPGADTFAGHQTMMGADMSHATVCVLAHRSREVTSILREAGHEVTGTSILTVDGSVVVHDNLEADPGLNWNVTGRTNEVTFAQVLAIAHLVRQVAPVARVIAVGGRCDEPLMTYVRPGPAGTVGVDTPATGFYTNGSLEVVHLGVPIMHGLQLPQRAAAAHINVALVGKAADILVTDTAVARYPGVNTDEILERTAALLDLARLSEEQSLLVVNVQETDLAGHQQALDRYAGLVEKVDAWLATQLPQLRHDEVLIVTADHGNDPTIGHAFHTREYVPALVIKPGPGQAVRGTDLDCLASIGAYVAETLGAGPLGYGVSAGVGVPA